MLVHSLHHSLLDHLQHHMPVVAQLSMYTDKGRVGAASHEDDNKTPRYLEQTAGGYWTAYYCPDLSAQKQGDVWRGRPGDVRRAFGG